MIITDQYVLNEFWSGKILYMNKSTFTDDVKQYLQNRYVDSKSYKETMWRIKYQIDIRPKCKYCGKDTNFKGKVNYIFSDFCSKECKHNSGLIGLHIKQTKEKLYGDKNYVNPNKAKQTKLKRYGNSSYHNIEKMKQTNIIKYGFENVFSNQNIINKCKISKLNKYCDENYNNREKAQKTCLERYGCTNYVNVKKMKQTCLEKYGVDHPNKLFINRKKISYLLSLPQIQNKINNTKRKNNSFHISKQEEESYKLLKEKYSDVIRQYRSKLYPFNCDFYIPSLDLYIECNYNWTHGAHPYNENDINDKYIIEQWKNKNTNFYLNAINTWTIRDVNKRNMAKQNNLNYIEFWDINELKTWINEKCE